MENKTTYITIIVMLLVVLVIAMYGWIHARNQLIGLNSSGSLSNVVDLSVCENATTLDSQSLCATKLQELQKLLVKYGNNQNKTN